MARQASVAPQAARRRMRLGPPAAALVLGGLVLVLAVAAVPLARLAHQSMTAASASVPVWVEVPLAVGATVTMLSEDAAYYAVADYRLHHGGLPLGWVALLARPTGVLGLVLIGLICLLSR